MTKPYPLTVTRDRYCGIYSDGVYLAWNLLPHDVPEEPDGDDITCANFWGEGWGLVGKGNTPEEAIKNLALIPGVRLA